MARSHHRDAQGGNPPSRRALRLLLTGALAATALASLVAAPARADGPDDQLSRLATAISADQQQLDQLNQRLALAEAALTRAEADLTAARSALASARTAREQAEIDDTVLQVAVQTAESTLTVTAVAVELGEQRLTQERRIAGAVVRQTTQQNAPLLGVAALVTNLHTGDINEQIQWSTTLFNTTQNTMDGLQSRQVQVEAAQQAQRDARARVTAARSAAATHLTRTREAETRATRLETEVAARVEASLAAKREFEAQLAGERARQAALKSEASSAEAKIKARMVLLQGLQSAVLGSGVLPLPVLGPLTSPFGMRVHPVTGDYSLHDGTDVGAGCGTPIRAPWAGVVAEEYYNAGYGNRLMIDHGLVSGHFLTTGYNHAQSYTVQVGDLVAAGQIIGYAGTTGYSTGCHLHLMVWQDGTVVDPMARWF